jgi:hypothetical protein
VGRLRHPSSRTRAGAASSTTSEVITDGAGGVAAYVSANAPADVGADAVGNATARVGCPMGIGGGDSSATSITGDAGSPHATSANVAKTPKTCPQRPHASATVERMTATMRRPTTVRNRSGHDTISRMRT